MCSHLTELSTNPFRWRSVTDPSRWLGSLAGVETGAADVQCNDRSHRRDTRVWSRHHFIFVILSNSNPVLFAFAFLIFSFINFKSLFYRREMCSTCSTDDVAPFHVCFDIPEQFGPKTHTAHPRGWRRLIIFLLFCFGTHHFQDVRFFDASDELFPGYDPQFTKKIDTKRNAPAPKNHTRNYAIQTQVRALGRRRPFPSG